MDLSPKDIAGFRKAQALALACAAELARALRPGWTEQRAAERMDTWLRDRGVRSFLHPSFAWFGERTRFAGVGGYGDLQPTRRRLLARDAVVLDAAPVVDGYPGDLSYSLALKPAAAYAKAREDLLRLRARVCELFARGGCPEEVRAEASLWLRRRGYDDCATGFPFALPLYRARRAGPARAWSAPHGHDYWSALARRLAPELAAKAESGAARGLWVVETHLGARGFGLRAVELLLVEEGSARWLADAAPVAGGPRRARGPAPLTVVVGACSGLGRALALACARRGHRVAAIDEDEARLAELGEALGRERAGLRAARLASWTALRAAARGIVRDAGRPSLWINAAAVAAAGAFASTKPEDFDRVLDLNFRAAVHGTRAALECLRGAEGAAIVNVASVAGSVAAPYMAAYAAATQALAVFTRSLQKESPGPRVVLVVPGLAGTPRLESAPGFAIPAFLDWALSDPESVAEEILAGITQGETEIRPTVHARLLLRLERLAPGLAGKLAKLATASGWKDLLGLG